METQVLSIAEKYVETYFPDCEVALLSGSFARGDQTASSDLDLFILDPKQSYRKSAFFEGKPVEVFVYSSESLPYTFYIEKQQGIPLIIRMCSEGIILRGGTTAQNLIDKGKQLLMEGPDELPSYRVDELRYVISDMLTDLEASSHRMENDFTVCSLIEVLHFFILRMNRCWTGEGKWVYRSLKAFDPALCESLNTCLNDYFKIQNKNSLIQFIDQQLAPYGGRLFDGYSG
ncbi:nucleotidyltransferase domain-containing protein [Jeotgalibacillus sp. R-1-5s-1]|uniref:nucleotidyltransferase domain-containing protein n=1 Tax=Jeotgalibacillus sp. R-1-5s-1 TaxID=2555897 RepID=UPI00106A9FAC|nr:nucleotidyltransferase domain-containing protein [Jeotgalibacillus sp. R-1-5s-1]TFD99907.1 nucleotidyltransferase domain-containing protein [Jeotgalibacillus sp. R-1-5s-1]